MAIERLRNRPLRVVALTDVGGCGQDVGERLARPDVLDRSRELVLVPGNEREPPVMTTDLPAKS